MLHDTISDSLHSVITIYYEDEKGNPAIYDMTEYYPGHSDRVLYFICGTIGPYYTSYNLIPAFCYNKNMLDTMKRQTAPDGGILPLSLLDSLKAINYDLLDSFYKANPQLNTDTIYFESEYVGNDFYGMYQQEKSTCKYSFGIKNGYEKNYYSLEELRNVCVKNNAALKSEGTWKHGKKNGEWKEYSKSGDDITIQKWKNGKLKKEKKIHENFSEK